MQASPSNRLFRFLLAIKRYTASHRISFDQFLTEFKFLHPRAMGRFQFTRIVQRINQEGSNFEGLDLFIELSKDNEHLLKEDFKKWVLRMPDITIHKWGGSGAAKRPSVERAQPHVQTRAEIVDRGRTALSNFIHAKDKNPEKIFDDCDLDHSGGIDRTEFNKFLFASSLPEFKSKDVCRYLISHLFDNHPSGRITKPEFFQFFKNSPLPERKEFHRGVTLPVSRVASLHPIDKKKAIGKAGKKNPEYDEDDSHLFSQLHNQTKSMQADPKMEPIVNPKINPKIDPKTQPEVTPKVDPKGKKNVQPQPQTKIQPQQKGKQPQKQAVTPNTSKPAELNLCKAYFHGDNLSPQNVAYAQELERMLQAKKIYEDPKNPTPEQKAGDYIWAKEYFENEAYQLFAMSAEDLNRQRRSLGIGKFIKADDIFQGGAGDCFFLSAIGSLAAKYPELLSERFLFQVNPAGYYCVQMFVDGQWKTFKTDQKFVASEGELSYTKPHENQIWVMLLEKCYAKMFGSFHAIDGGNSGEAFITLTGAPIDYINLADEKQGENLKKKLEDLDRSGSILAATGSDYMGKLSEKELQKLGLVKGHVYSLLGIYQVGETLVKLRNPWGNFEWQGDWGFDSNKWTKQMKQQLDYEDKNDDGSFFMSWKDFKLYYQYIDVCKVNPTFTHTSLRMINNKRKSNYVEMKVTTAGFYHVFICQESERKYQGQKYTLSPARIIIMKKSDKGPMTFVGAANTFADQMTIFEGNFEKGTYLISAKVQWNSWTDHETFLTSYGVDKVVFEKAKRQIAPKFKVDLINSFSTINEGKGEMRTYESSDLPDATGEIYLSMDEGIGFSKISNNSDSTLKVEMNFTINGGKFIKPKTNPCVYKLGPGKSDVVGFFISAEGFDYAYEETVTIK